MFKVARKNLRAHKLRTLFTAIAIALGVGFMAGTFVLTDTVSKSFDNIFTEANAGIDAVVRAEATVEASAFDGGEQRPDLDPALLGTVRSVDGVKQAELAVFGFASVIDEDGKPLNTTGPPFGANWTGIPAFDVFEIEEGKAPRGDEQALVDRFTADKGGIEVGDRRKVQTLTGIITVEVTGIVAFGDSGNLAGASVVMMETPAALRNFTVGGKVQQIPVIADEGVSEEELAKRLNDALPPGVEAITAEQSTEETREQVSTFLGTFQIILNAFAAIALLAGAFLIYTTFGIVIGQRVRELALLRAMGASRSQVTGSVVTESAVIGLLASLLGLAGGIALAVMLQSLLATAGFGDTATPPVIAPRTLVASVVVGVFVSVLCAVVPARRAGRVPPVAAMRDVAVESTRQSRARLVIGSVMGVVGIVLITVGSQTSGNQGVLLGAVGTIVVFAAAVILGPYIAPPLATLLGAPMKAAGVSGAMGRDNARRNPKRSASTAAALMLSVTLITLIATFTLSFGKSINAATDEHFKGDLEVTGSGFGFPSIGPVLVDDLAAHPEVAAVTGVQRGIVEIDGESRPVYGVRFSDVEKVFDLGPTEGDIGGLGADQIAIDRETAREEALAIGDTVDITLPDGTTGRFRVGAIYDNGGIVAQNPDGHYLVSDQVFRDHFPAAAQFLFRVDVTGAEGVSVEQLRAVVEKEADAFPAATVRDVGEIKRENNRQLAFALVIFFALLGLALVIGALGVAITVALSVFERTREIGLLRAVGATRRQMAMAICAESVILTLLGTILGLVIGIAGGVAIISTFDDTIDTLRISVQPAFLIGVLILAIVIGVAASIIPAVRAARMNVLAAITVE